MNTCGTCKYFGELIRDLDAYDAEQDYAEIPNTRLHKCDLLKHLNVSGDSSERIAMQREPAGVIDGSGYHAAFCVSEEFGCNQHTPRT